MSEKNAENAWQKQLYRAMSEGEIDGETRGVGVRHEGGYIITLDNWYSPRDLYPHCLMTVETKHGVKRELLEMEQNKAIAKTVAKHHELEAARAETKPKPQRESND